MARREWITAEEIEAVRRRVEAGELARARRAINRWTASRIPRRSLAAAARLARGVRLHLLALKWLHPVVRPERGMGEATPAERIEYVRALIAYGSFREAESILGGLDPAEYPDAGWTRAFLRMRVWDWSGAVPILERALSRKDLRPLSRAQARLNLAAALIHGPADMERARAVLDEAGAELPPGAGRIELDLAQLRAQSQLFEGRPGPAREEIAAIRRRIARRGTTFLHARVHELTETAAQLETPDDARFRRKMSEVAARFEALGFPEFARAALYRAALWTNDGDALDRLYFGTPHEAFRRRLESERRDGRLAPFAFRWIFGRGSGPLFELDVATGSTGRRGTRLKAGQVPHRTLVALASDLYRPLSIGELAQLIYPDDHIHPNRSALKVHQGLRRLKDWFEAERIPMRIATVGGGYRIESSSPVALVLRREPEAGASPRLPAAVLNRLERLLDRPGETEFGLRDAIAAWKVSERSARRTLSAGVSAGLLLRRGAGPGTRYRRP